MTSPAHLHRGGQQVAELVWPATESERERMFENWLSAATQCLRAGNSDFAIVVALRKLLRWNGIIVASNAELTMAAGCTTKSLEFDLATMKRHGFISCRMQPVKGVRGQRRVIRLSKPAPDNGDPT